MSNHLTSSPVPICAYASECAGCQSLHLNYNDQSLEKVRDLQMHLASKNLAFAQGQEIQFLSAGEFYLRDRLDFSWQQGRLGLYDQNRTGIIDIEKCLQLSPGLQAFLTEFRKIPWPMEKASFRLRVSPTGRLGVWIDCANVDVKKLLDDQIMLRELQKLCFVEVGQRRKVPLKKAEGYKLSEPQLHPWFRTWMGEVPIDLQCNVASFTQPSLVANRLIADTLSLWVQEFGSPKILEFGSGIGNLTLPALTYAKSVTACEIDRLSLAGLEKTLALAGLQNRVEVHAGDFQKKLTQDFSQFDLILCNPPRSGLMDFLRPLEQLAAADRPPGFIYMSCFPESLVKDLARLTAKGYLIKKMCIIDQFPQTKHYEVLCLLQREKL